MKQITVTLDAGLLNQIDESKDDLEITRSEWLREAARQKIAREVDQ